MIDTIIFDLDGTLLNTLDDLTNSVNYALSKVGCVVRGIDEVKGFVGNGVGLLIERALPADKKALKSECLKIFEKHYNANKSVFTKPYAGICEMIDLVVKSGYKTAIVSNKYDEAVVELKQKEFANIDVAVGERLGVEKKPAPDMINIALKMLNKTQAQAVYVGDSDVDVLTARNSGLKMVAVTWGFRDRALLESMNADIIIDDPKELLQAISKL